MNQSEKLRPFYPQCECWKDIAGYEGQYMVSYSGHVASMPNKKCKTTRILKGWIDAKGYKRIQIGGWQKKDHRLVHILTATHFKPNPDNLPEVNHLDGIKANAHADNLQWCTHATNMDHAKTTGLMNGLKGDRNHFSKLNETQVWEIIESDRERKDIAKDYNISVSAVIKIQLGLTWKHLNQAI